MGRDDDVELLAIGLKIHYVGSSMRVASPESAREALDRHRTFLSS